MLSQLGCPKEDTEVDPQLGYPLVYPKLCRNAHAAAAGLPLPYREGPPKRFLPYSPLAEDFAHLKDWDNVFPVVAEREKDSLNTRKHAEELWQQLDHLGNAGFDPAKFRVDSYGNVVYWNADPSSPLAWDIDYWFPQPRGGKALLPNLRIMQWQAYLRKRNRLEFLVPCWDLQHGCSINQFLSAFAAKNADFRKRSFALFFAGGEDESVAREHVGECRPWPQQFREKKAVSGLAAAAIVSVSKEIVKADCDSVGPSEGPTSSDVPRILGAHPYAGAPSKRHWSVEEEEAVKRGVTKFGPGSWKEIKEDDTALANRSISQIKEKFRLMKGVSRRGTRESASSSPGLSGRQSAATTALQKELRVKIMREEKRREREEELAQLEETVTKLKVENEKERLKALELETLLKKHKHRVEKQRKWAESQASYRLCLERVLRDTMHQTMTYKEQARLTREACNVLIARLDSQKAACEAMEHELLHRHSQREVLEAAAGGNTDDRTPFMHKKMITQGREIVDVSSCVSLRASDEDDDEEEEEKNLIMTANKFSESDTDDEGEDEVYSLWREHQQGSRTPIGRHPPKVAMQVEDTKDDADGDSQWDMPSGIPKPPCPIQASKYVRNGATKIDDIMPPTHQQYDADSETQGSESESDFADDEMSPAVAISGSDDKLVSELSRFHEGPTSELRDFCTRNAKPGDGSTLVTDYTKQGGLVPEPAALDSSVTSANESLRSDQSKQEVQKDVIMVRQTESASSKETSTAGATPGTPTKPLCKQQYIDELLQQIRFQIPTSELSEQIKTSGKSYMSEENLDELLDQVLKTQVRRSDARQHQLSDVDDEKLKEIGKSNLDKWLQALLFKPDADHQRVCASPGRPANSPGLQLSKISMAAMRKSLELARHQELVNRDGENAERPRSRSWGAILRKLTVKHHDSETSLFDYDAVDNAPRLSDQEAGDATTSPLTSSSPCNNPNHSGSSTPTHGTESSSCTTTLAGWPGGNPTLNTIASNYWTKDPTTATTTDQLSDDSPAVWKTERRVEDGVHVDYPHSFEKRHFPQPLSDVDEISETESCTDNSPDHTPVTDRSDSLARRKRRVSIKVAGFVGWKKSGSKRGDTKASHICDSPPPPHISSTPLECL